MPGYEKYSDLMRYEIDSLLEEGHILNKEQCRKEIDDCHDDVGLLKKLYEKMMNSPINKDYKYIEPSTLAEIIAESDFNLLEKINAPVSFDKIHGALLSRIIGCILGLPVEGFNYQKIKTYLSKANAYPLNDYFPKFSKSIEEDDVKLINLHCTKEELKFAPTDDDIRFVILAYLLVAKKGVNFDIYDVGTNWVENLPIRMVCTAETQAYLNFVNCDRVLPWNRKPSDFEIIMKDVSTYMNPYRQWIGAQIRIDTYGYVAANNPKLAAKMAFVDSSFSHTKNGIYGAMYFAALISIAFSAKSIKEAIVEALKVVPKKSKLYEAILETIIMVENMTTVDQLIIDLNAKYENLFFVHTINNACICIASLLVGNGDFEKTLSVSIMMGLDTDCNGATVGSVIGAFLGVDKIPEKYSKPLNDTLYSSLPDFHPIHISLMAKKIEDLYKKTKE